MRFYSTVPNQVIRPIVTRHGVALCEEVRFEHDVLDTEDDTIRDEVTNKACEAYLLAIAARPGSGIGTKSNADVDADTVAAREADMRALAERTHQRLVAAGERT